MAVSYCVCGHSNKVHTTRSLTPGKGIPCKMCSCKGFQMAGPFMSDDMKATMAAEDYYGRHLPPPPVRRSRRIGAIFVEPTFTDGRYSSVPAWNVWKVNTEGEMRLIGHSTQLNRALQQARDKFPKIVYEEIYAYRGWNLYGDVLLPLTRKDMANAWTGPVQTITEFDEDEGHGLYSIKIIPAYMSKLQHEYEPMVTGVVQLFGRVIEYSHGYRSQTQVIRGLVVHLPVSDKFLELLGDRFQCEVKLGMQLERRW